jgi:hypothetical protein
MAQRDLEKVGRTPLLGLGGAALRPNVYDLAIFVLIAAAFVAMAHGEIFLDEQSAYLESETFMLYAV